MCLCVVYYLNTCSKMVENTVREQGLVEKGPRNEDGYWAYSLSAVLCLNKVQYGLTVQTYYACVCVCFFFPPLFCLFVLKFYWREEHIAMLTTVI